VNKERLGSFGSYRRVFGAPLVAEQLLKVAIVDKTQGQDEGGLGGTTDNRSGRQVAWDVITLNNLSLLKSRQAPSHD
jgi:hypothetical protein